MLKFNGNILKVNGSMINYAVYSVSCSATHGQVLAVPETGVYGTTVNIYSIPDAGYELDYYLINGVAISGNTFTLIGDTTVIGVFKVAIPSVTINGQTWMSKNLAIDDGQGGIIKKTNVTTCGVNIGTQYYYTREAAARVAESITGWHLPSGDDWQALINYAGNNGKPLKSTSGWASGPYASYYNGTNTLGFNLLASGYLDTNETLHVGTGSSADTDTWIFTSDNKFANFNLTASVETGGSTVGFTTIRLIKD